MVELVEQGLPDQQAQPEGQGQQAALAGLVVLALRVSRERRGQKVVRAVQEESGGLVAPAPPAQLEQQEGLEVQAGLEPQAQQERRGAQGGLEGLVEPGTLAQQERQVLKEEQVVRAGLAVLEGPEGLVLLARLVQPEGQEAQGLLVELVQQG